VAAAAAQAQFVVSLLGVEVDDKMGSRQQDLRALREGDWCDGFGDR